MQTILKEVEHSPLYKKAGFMLDTNSANGKRIPMIRCLGCFQHLSLAEISIVNGVLGGDVTCPNDLYVNSDIKLSKKINKDAQKVYIK